MLRIAHILCQKVHQILAYKAPYRSFTGMAKKNDSQSPRLDTLAFLFLSFSLYYRKIKISRFTYIFVASKGRSRIGIHEATAFFRIRPCHGKQ